jgi:hypothetical protein
MSDIPQIKLGEETENTVQVEEKGAIIIPKMKTVDEDKRKRIKEKKERKSRWYKRLFKSKKVKILGIILVVLMALTSVLALQLFRLYKSATLVKASVESLVAAGKSQDLPKIKTELQKTKDLVNQLSDTSKPLLWMRHTPVVGKYVDDAEHGIKAAQHGISAMETVIEIIEPYADIIGFVPGESEDASSGQETAQDRLEFVIATIPEIVPHADELIEKVSKIREEIDQIDPEHYPQEFAGRQVRPVIKRGVELVDLGADLVENSKPLLEAAPYLLGVDGERKYLVLFQNDKELRPTGGFITAYSVAKVHKGKFEPVASSDIYDLDGRYKPSIKADDPIIKYLRGPYLISKNLRLRDMNWSPDFYESMKLFVEEVESIGISDIDGVIAVDTELLVNILDVLGPIGVPGYGNFSTEITPECNCSQVIYELESFADIEGPIVWSQDEPGKIIYAPPNYDNRKKIIGPLMNSVLSNALGQSKEKIPMLFEAVFKSLLEKHVLFYMLSEDTQQAVESFGIAGRIEEFDGDYLHINDANLGGRKSNLYVTSEVSQEVELGKDGSIIKTVIITYKNPEKYDGWLNSVLPNWVRIYVPAGSELIDFQGVEEKKDPYEEFGKSVFAGFFELRPLGVAKVTVKYKLPFKAGEEYRLLIQKQPGTGKPLHTIKIGKREEEFFLRTDKEIKIAL